MKKSCDPAEIALKTFFLGPQAEGGEWLLKVVNKVLTNWFQWRRKIYPEDGSAISIYDQNISEFIQKREDFESYLFQLFTWFENETPKFSPRYMGHMFSEISLPAFLGHLVTLLHNPNNILAEASRVGVRIEKEAISALAKMMGYDIAHSKGHFTSGGTVANFEAMIRARARLQKWLFSGLTEGSLFEVAHVGWDRYSKHIKKTEGKTELNTTNPFLQAQFLEKTFKQSYLGPIILVSKSMHYSWVKGANLLGLGKEAIWGVELDSHGHMCVSDLEKKIELAKKSQRPILMVVSVFGSTERGSLDNIHLVDDIISTWAKEGIHLWHHVDAAYGGYFRTLSKSTGELSEQASEALHAINQANSITLDPHKLGYVPYSCGTVLVKSAQEYALDSIDAPYLDFNKDLDPGLVTLEGSRSAAGAAATWMTAKCIGFDSNGYGRIIERTIRAAKRLENLLAQASPKIKVLPDRDTNIVCFCIANENEPISKTNLETLKIFEAFSPAQNSQFMVSKTALSWSAYGQFLNKFIETWSGVKDTEALTVIRLCLMNPFYDSKEMHTDFSIELSNALIELLKK